MRSDPRFEIAQIDHDAASVAYPGEFIGREHVVDFAFRNREVGRRFFDCHEPSRRNVGNVQRLLNGDPARRFDELRQNVRCRRWVF